MDSPTDEPRLDEFSADDRLLSWRLRLASWTPIVVGVLVLGTAWAVASVSYWLVPPYLLVMAFLLFEPQSRRVNATNPDEGESASASAGSEPPETEVSNPEGTEPPTDLGTSAPPRSDVAPPPKARRSRKSKKARPTPEPTPATWVQVAPGKFVRVESAETSVESGPHPAPPHSEEEPARTPSVDSLDDESFPEIPPPVSDSGHAGESFPEPGDASDFGHEPAAAPDACFEAPQTDFEPELPTPTDDEQTLSDEERPTEAESMDPGDLPESVDHASFDSDSEFEAEPDVEDDWDDGSFEDEFQADQECAEDPDRAEIFDADPAPVPVPRSQTTNDAPTLANVRTDRAHRLPAGFRRRSPRSDARRRRLIRTFPPRSPPARPRS